MANENQLPNVVINQLGNRLGRIPDTQDGLALLMVTTNNAPSGASLDELITVKSLKESEDLGIDASYDDANKVVVYQHIKDFYSQAETGVELLIVLTSNIGAVTLADLVDKEKDYVKNYLDIRDDIKLVGVAHNPDSPPTITNGLDAEVVAAVTKAKELREDEESINRFQSYIIEGRSNGAGGSVVFSENLRTLGANHVSVVITSKPNSDFKFTNSPEVDYRKGYASIGLLLGRLAAISVNRNVGRVKDGPVTTDDFGFSNGMTLSDYTDTDLDSIHQKGYIFLKPHMNYPGLYFNDDSTATTVDDDFAGISAGRVIDKASRIAKRIYTNELLDEIELDDTGEMRPSAANYFQTVLETAIGTEMAGEISNVSVQVIKKPGDPPLVSTGNIPVEVNITQRGQAKTITVNLGFTPPVIST